MECRITSVGSAALPDHAALSAYGELRRAAERPKGFLEFDLIAFVTARLDEAEARANAMQHDDDSDPWVACPASRTEPLGDLEWGEEACSCGLAKRKARALREVAAKRTVLAWYAEAAEASALFREKLGTGTHMAVAAESYLNVIRVYAALCDDHPDYRVEWAPPGG